MARYRDLMELHPSARYVDGFATKLDGLAHVATFEARPGEAAEPQKELDELFNVVQAARGRGLPVKRATLRRVVLEFGATEAETKQALSPRSRPAQRCSRLARPRGNCGARPRLLDQHVASGALRYVHRPRDETRAPHVRRRRSRSLHRNPNTQGIAVVSVFKDARSPYWRYDFQTGGRRFFGSTKATTKRQAEAVERDEREKAR